MPRHDLCEYSPYTPAQLYALVVDVEKYPEFLPWCKAARILAHHPDSFEAELIISFKHIRESYVSRVMCDISTHSIHVTMLRGPFHHLINHWRFEAQAGGDSLIHFHIDFAFKHMLLEKIIGALFNKATQKMVQAFQQRAHALYGATK